MNKLSFRNTQRSIIYLVTVLALIVIGGLYYFNGLEHTRIAMMMKDEELESTLLLEKMVRFKAEGLNTFCQ